MLETLGGFRISGFFARESRAVRAVSRSASFKPSYCSLAHFCDSRPGEQCRRSLLSFFRQQNDREESRQRSLELSRRAGARKLGSPFFRWAECKFGFCAIVQRSGDDRLDFLPATQYRYGTRLPIVARPTAGKLGCFQLLQYV